MVSCEFELLDHAAYLSCLILFKLDPGCYISSVRWTTVWPCPNVWLARSDRTQLIIIISGCIVTWWLEVKSLVSTIYALRNISQETHNSLLRLACLCSRIQKLCKVIIQLGLTTCSIEHHFSSSTLLIQDTFLKPMASLAWLIALFPGSATGLTLSLQLISFKCVLCYLQDPKRVYLVQSFLHYVKGCKMQLSVFDFGDDTSTLWTPKIYWCGSCLNLHKVYLPFCKMCLSIHDSVIVTYFSSCLISIMSPIEQIYEMAKGSRTFQTVLIIEDRSI